MRGITIAVVVALGGMVAGSWSVAQSEEGRRPRRQPDVHTFERVKDEAPILAFHYHLPARFVGDTRIAHVYEVPIFVLWSDGTLLWSDAEQLLAGDGWREELMALEVWKGELDDESREALIEALQDADVLEPLRASERQEVPIDGGYAIVFACNSELPYFRNAEQFLVREFANPEVVYGVRQGWIELEGRSRAEVVEELPEEDRARRAPWDHLVELLRSAMPDAEDAERVDIETWGHSSRVPCEAATGRVEQ